MAKEFKDILTPVCEEKEGTSILLLGENHSNLVNGITAVYYSEDQLIESGKKIILFLEALPVRYTVVNHRMTFFGVGLPLTHKSEVKEAPYTIEALEKSRLSDRNINQLIELRAKGIEIYGLEDKKTDPCTTLCMTINNKDELYRQLIETVPFFSETKFRDELNKYYHTLNFDNFRIRAAELYGLSPDRISSPNEEFSKRIIAHLTEKAADGKPTLAIAVVGAAHIPEARTIDTHETIHQGIYARLAASAIPVTQCFVGGAKYGELDEYIPSGDSLEYGNIPQVAICTPTEKIVNIKAKL